MIGRTVSFSEPSPVSGLVTVQLSAQAPIHESAEQFENEKYCADGLIVRREGRVSAPEEDADQGFFQLLGELLLVSVSFKMCFLLCLLERLIISAHIPYMSGALL